MYLCHCDVPLDLGGIPRTVFESCSVIRTDSSMGGIPRTVFESCSVIRTDSLWAASLELSWSCSVMWLRP